METAATMSRAGACQGRYVFFLHETGSTRIPNRDRLSEEPDKDHLFYDADGFVGQMMCR